MKRAASKPVLITNAERSQDAQLRSREIRYATLMGIRIVCLIVGALVAYERVPLWGLWASICVAGMVLLPWMAVLIANDRAPRQEHTLRNRMHRRQPAPDEPAPPALSARVTLSAEAPAAPGASGAPAAKPTPPAPAADPSPDASPAEQS